LTGAEGASSATPRGRMTAVLEVATLGGSGSPSPGGPTVLDPQFRGGHLPGYAAALAGLSDAELQRVLERRPDLLSPPAPASFPELASRAGTPASLAAALRSLDLGALRLVELLAVLGPPTTVADLAAAAGPGLDPGRLEAGLAALAELGIALTGPDGSISGPPGLGAPFGRPGGLGPPVAELAKVGVSAERLERILANLGASRPPGGKPALVRAVSAALADPGVRRRSRSWPAGRARRRRWPPRCAPSTGGPCAWPSCWRCWACRRPWPTWPRRPVPGSTPAAWRAGWPPWPSWASP